MKMDYMDACVRARSLCLICFGIAVTIATFGECTVDPPQTRIPRAAPRKRCSFNKINYNVGENWNPFLLPAGYWRCIRCSCKLTSDGSKATVDCKSCRSGTASDQHPDEGQASCTHNGVLRTHGSVWAEATTDPLPYNQCTECSCTDQFVTCAVRTCPILHCQHQVIGHNTCCPICRGDSQGASDRTDCKTMGRSYRHLENWFPKKSPRHDLCVICSCKNTSVECQKVVCPTLTCNNPERKPGACCDSCPAPASASENMQNKNGSSLESTQIKNGSALENSQNMNGSASENMQNKNDESGECERAGSKIPHNTTFNPTIGPFGASVCVTCFCNRSVIHCTAEQCPANYSCEKPVNVPGKCCKVCEEGDFKGPANGKRPCTAGKYWLVYEYMWNGNTSRNRNYFRVQFALMSSESGIVEIHTISANATVKTVKIVNTTRNDFKKMEEDNQYRSTGKIRDVQRNKMKNNEKRPCGTQGCIHTVKKIMERFWNRVGQCNVGIPGFGPDSLLMPEKETPSDE